jgi:large subunit ribosomal protein L4
MKPKSLNAESIHPLIAKVEVHPHLIYQNAVMSLANRRVGTAHTKDRSEVSGGGKKPWRQKGTGRARHGSTRSPIWRKGGVTFGPRTRDYSYDLPKKMKVLGLLAGVKEKAKEGRCYVMDDFNVKTGKTKESSNWMKKVSFKKPLIISDQFDGHTLRSTKNLKKLTLVTSNQVTLFDVLESHECVFTRKGYDAMIERAKKRIE